MGGKTGSGLILTMLFMAIVSTGSAESIAVSSLVAYDIYREYINPEATGEQILFVSRCVIVGFGLVMGALAVLLDVMGLNLGWVYLFMGIVIGSAVIPLWNMMTWEKASGTGAVVAAWSGLCLAVISWLVACSVQSGSVTVDNLGKNETMLTGNLFAIISSGIIHFVWSMMYPQADFSFAELDSKIKLVEEEDTSGLTAEDKDPVMLEKSKKWIVWRGWVLTIVLVVIWPILSIPAGVFSKDYFAMWVLIAIAWGFGAAITVTLLPLLESSEEISVTVNGMLGKSSDPVEVSDKKDSFDDNA